MAEKGAGFAFGYAPQSPLARYPALFPWRVWGAWLALWLSLDTSRAIGLRPPGMAEKGAGFAFGYAPQSPLARYPALFPWRVWGAWLALWLSLDTSRAIGLRPPGMAEKGAGFAFGYAPQSPLARYPALFPWRVWGAWLALWLSLDTSRAIGLRPPGMAEKGAGFAFGYAPQSPLARYPALFPWRVWGAWLALWLSLDTSRAIGLRPPGMAEKGAVFAFGYAPQSPLARCPALFSWRVWDAWLLLSAEFRFVFFQSRKKFVVGTMIQFAQRNQYACADVQFAAFIFGIGPSFNVTAVQL